MNPMPHDSFDAPRLQPSAPGWVCLLVVAASFTCKPDPVLALGFRIPNQDPEAIARGNAFVATANNPAAIYYNPAGITQLEGIEFQAGALFYLGVRVDYTSPTGQEIENEREAVPVPHLHVVYSPSELPVSFGLGLYAPFGLSMEWPQETPFRSLAIDAQLDYLTINPVVAWQLRPNLSLAAGPTVNYSSTELRRGIGLLPGDSFKFEGEDWQAGFNAGLLWQPHPRWSVGLNYRSGTTMEYAGHASTTPSPPLPPRQEATAQIEFPQIIAAGVSFRPSPRWNLEVNVDWTDWDTLDTVEIEGVASLPFHWQSSFFYHAGATYYFNNGFQVSAGYFFSENSTTDEYYNPLVPDTDLHVGSLGLAYRAKHWRFALAGQIIAGPNHRVSNSIPNPITGESANGSYQLFIPAVSFSVGRHF
jgi:long-chain fatty acid transport protein